MANDEDSAAEPYRVRRSKGGVQAPATSKKPPARRRALKISAITLGVIASLVIIAVVISAFWLRNLQTTFDENRNVIEGLELEDDTEYRTQEGTVNILLLGTDSRGDDEDQYRDETGEGGERSDTIMFAHIPEDRSGIYVMSIMRDLWVDIPGHGSARINSAFSFGREDLVVDTVENLLYTHIDHVAIIDFEGFADLTEALGGVYVDNPQAFSAGQRNPAFYPEGTIRLEGSNALRYVRERKAFPTSDYVRVENQQRVVRAIVERFISSDTLSNPQRVFDVVESISPYLEVDNALDASTIAGYALDMTSIRSNDIHMFTLPSGEPYRTAGGAEVILPDEQALDTLQDALAQEDMGSFVQYIESDGQEQFAQDADPFSGISGFMPGAERPGEYVGDRFSQMLDRTRE